MNSVIIRPMLPIDLPRVVAIHLASFPGFFLTFLGPGFLTLLYKNIICDPDGIALTAIVEDQIEGFVVGVVGQSGFYRRLLKHQKWEFAAAAMTALLKRPLIAPRLLRVLNRPADAEQSETDAWLMSIAVRPLAEGRGIGRELVVAFCQSLVVRRVAAVRLTTDRDHNDRVNSFYQQLGFQISRVFVTPEGRVMNEYVHYLG